MKLFITMVAIASMLIMPACYGQIKNSTSESVKIYGNCGMCKSKIEAAGSIAKVAKVEWNEETKIATLTYNKTKTNREEILKRIALAGYDSDSFLAPDDVYANLHKCCQYDRVKKIAVKTVAPIENNALTEDTNLEDQPITVSTTSDLNPPAEMPASESKAGQVSDASAQPSHSQHTAPDATTDSKKDKVTEKSAATTSNANPKKTSQSSSAGNKATVQKSELMKSDAKYLKALFDSYFGLKDALVKTDANAAALKANELLAFIKAVKMESLGAEEHMVWMKVYKKLMADSESISISKDVKKQRSSFITLSKNMYDLIKAAKYNTDVYYQFCPMANDGKGANWLSKEKAVKNPYYGNEMLSCGKVVETIKN